MKNIKKKLNNEVYKVEKTNNFWSIFCSNEIILSKNLIVTFPFLQSKRLLGNYLNKNMKKLSLSMQPNITLMVLEKKNNNNPISSIKFKNKIIAWASNENSKKRFFSNRKLWTIQSTIPFAKKIINKYKSIKINIQI